MSGNDGVTIEELDHCIVLNFFNLIGKKWSYPLIYALDPDRSYSFEELISFSGRRINRTMLSNTLKELYLMGIIDKNDGKYKLNNKGIKLKKIFSEIKDILLDDCSNCLEKWKDNCEIINYFKNIKINE